jgi:formylglycine-generating enzyme
VRQGSGGAEEWGRERQRKGGGAAGDRIMNAVGMEMVRIEPGTLRVGSFQPECPDAPPAVAADAPPSRGPRRDPRARWTMEDVRRCAELAARDARPGFTVAVPRPFEIGRYPVTQAEWRRVMGTNPSVFQGNRVEGGSDRHPVDNVTWEDAQAFVARLNEMEPGAGYRLPTEFEWEYAARAGAEEELPWPVLRDHAWIGLVDKGTTRPVGQKLPNAWGLHDMLGNVWEWVEDYYNHRIFPDPVPPRTGTVRVLRGGSFLSDVKNATFAGRGAGPGNGFDVGFRVVRDAR